MAASSSIHQSRVPDAVQPTRKRSRSWTSGDSIVEHASQKCCSSGDIRGHLPAILEAKPYDPLLQYGELERVGPAWVLAEEDYVELLDFVIRRDFFPYLDRLYRCTGSQRSQLPSNCGSIPSTVWSASSTPLARSPSVIGFSTQSPSSRSKTDNSVLKYLRLKDGRRLKVDVSNLTLSKFQNLFTSEDNASFVALVATEKAKLAQQQMACMEMAVLRAENRNREVIEAQGRGERPCRLIYANCAEPRNALMFPISSNRTRVQRITTMGILRESAAAGSTWAKRTLERSSLDPSEPDHRVLALCVGDHSNESGTNMSREGSIVPSNTRFSSGGDTTTGDALISNLTLQQTARKVRLEGDARRFQLLDSMVEEGLFSKTALARRLLDDESDGVSLASLGNPYKDEVPATTLLAPSSCSPAPSSTESLVCHPITGHALLRSPHPGESSASFALPDVPRKEATAHKLLAKALLRRAQGNATAEGAAALVAQQCSNKRLQERLAGIFPARRNATVASESSSGFRGSSVGSHSTLLPAAGAISRRATRHSLAAPCSRSLLATSVYLVANSNSPTNSTCVPRKRASTGGPC